MASVTWSPEMADLHKYFEELPSDLGDGGADLARDAAKDAADNLQAAYPRRSGALASGVRVQEQHLPYGALLTVVNIVRYARAFEYGTQARHTRLGANRGPMPARPTAIPIFVRRRRRLIADCRALMEKHALTVHGDG